MLLLEALPSRFAVQGWQSVAKKVMCMTRTSCKPFEGSVIPRFFPIFFAKEVSLSPVAVNVLMAAQPVMIGLCATMGRWLSKFIGVGKQTSQETSEQLVSGMEYACIPVNCLMMS